MSITTSYKTEIVLPKPQLRSFQGNIKGSPCMGIMQLAVDKIVKERGGAVTQGYQDCAGKAHPCIMGLSTPAFPRGIGVGLDAEGQVLFQYDQEGANVNEAKAICNDLARAYAVVAVMRVRQKQGYRVSIEKETPGASGVEVQTIAVRQ